MWAGLHIAESSLFTFTPASSFILFYFVYFGRSSLSDSGLRKERRRKKKVTNIISFDDDLDGGAEDEEEAEDDSQRNAVLRKSHTAPAQSSVEEGVEPNLSESPAQNGLAEPGVVSWVGSPHPCRTAPESPPPLPDNKGVDNEDEEEEEMYKPRTPSVEDEKILTDL